MTIIRVNEHLYRVDMPTGSYTVVFDTDDMAWEIFHDKQKLSYGHDDLSLCFDWLEEKINKDLIGGFIIRVGDKQVDASIARKLNNLKRGFKENPFVKEF